MAQSRLAFSREAKIEKRKKIEALGMNPHPYGFSASHTIADARNAMGQHVIVAGRIRAVREHGKISFLILQDETASIQVMCREENTQQYNLVTLLDAGDFLGVSGTVITSKTGEITIDATTLVVLGKSLRPLPNSWQEIDDQEIRYRKRYLDLLIRPETKKVLDARWLVEKEIRRYMQDVEGYTEVETPILQPLYGGTNARPFTTHMNALDCDFYLRIAPELYLKRLIVGGYERIFEIARNFRNEGIDQTHQPEFTMIEWYEAYADYQRIMDVTEGLVKHLVSRLYGKTNLQVGEHTIDVGGAWPRITMKNALKQFEHINLDSVDDTALADLLRERNIELTGSFSRGKAIFALFDHVVTPKLINPTWIIDYPKEVSPLSKQHRLQPELVERFECYIGGKEICDGWSEITDALDQRARFENEQKNMREGDEEAQPMDEEFIEAMEYGMPPLGGIGIGIDRLVMFLTNTWSIKEVIAFPTLRPLNQQKSTIVPKAVTFSNNYTISKDVSEKFPGMYYAYLKISGVTIRQKEDQLEKAKSQIVQNLEQHKKTIENEAIQAYKDIFRKMEVDIHSKRPSPEALLRRIISGKSLYTINTAVDSYNLSVIESGVGLGGFDADTLQEPVSLRFAKQGEKMLLLGDEDITTLEGGELVYADTKKPLTLHLNYRDIDQTKITEKTKNIILFADGAPHLPKEQVIRALEQGALYIQKYCGGTITSVQVVEEASENIKQKSSVSIPLRELSQTLLKTYIKNDALIHHSEMVAAALEAYAQQLGEDVELWYATGLLHDLDWEMFPDEHPNRAIAELLNDYPDEMKNAIAAHAPDRSGVQPESLLAKYLFACDELSGLMHAASLMRPNGFTDMEAKSVLKKIKDTAFARNISRDDIRRGLELIGKEPKEHVEFLIGVFRK